MKFIKNALGNAVSYNIIINREKHIEKSDITELQEINRIEFDRVIYAKKYTENHLLIMIDDTINVEKETNRDGNDR